MNRNDESNARQDSFWNLASEMWVQILRSLITITSRLHLWSHQLTGFKGIIHFVTHLLTDFEYFTSLLYSDSRSIICYHWYLLAPPRMYDVCRAWCPSYHQTLRGIFLLRTKTCEWWFFRTPIPGEMRSRSTVSVIHGLLCNVVDLGWLCAVRVLSKIWKFRRHP